MITCIVLNLYKLDGQQQFQQQFYGLDTFNINILIRRKRKHKMLMRLKWISNLNSEVAKVQVLKFSLVYSEATY